MIELQWLAGHWLLPMKILAFVCFLYATIQIFCNCYVIIMIYVLVSFLFLVYFQFSLLVLLLTDYGLAASKNNTSTKVSPTTKPADKTSYPKKVSTLKKRPSKPSLKKVADITDKFKDLPADDLAFIKELDKQFKLHGGKVKIKVENDNATTTKNSKRTIEGDLG